MIRKRIAAIGTKSILIADQMKRFVHFKFSSHLFYRSINPLIHMYEMVFPNPRRFVRNVGMNSAELVS